MAKASSQKGTIAQGSADGISERAKRRVSAAWLLEGAFEGNIRKVTNALEWGAPIDTADAITGMTALHLAVGRDHLDLTRFLVERGASFVPDKQGRTPTTIAAECEVSEELCDFIAEAEAVAEARAGGV